MNDYFSEKDVVRSHKWFNHAQWGFTEFVAFDPEYLPGPENFEANFKNFRFPVVWYGKTAEVAVNFVMRYGKSHTCCYGVNPRPRVLYSKSGGKRRTGDAGIELVTNFYFDIDPVGDPTDEQVGEAGLFVEGTNVYFEDLGLLPPTTAFTGRGYHKVFAFPPIKVEECPDIKDRLQVFRNGFVKAFAKKLSALGLKVDSTFDLSRLAKIYGTTKPGAARVSRFLGGERKEDDAFREYLLNLSIEEKPSVLAKLPEALPQGFERLLGEDEKVRELWEGIGKTEGDTSSTGYDFSLVKHCLSKGITDINDLAAILGLRPNGAVRASGKGMQYIKLTIANAIKG